MRLLIIAATKSALYNDVFNEAILRGYEVFLFNASKIEYPYKSTSDFEYFNETEPLIELINNYKIDNVLIISSERSIVRDGKLSDYLRKKGINVFGNGEKMSEICFSKKATKEFLSNKGFHVLKGNSTKGIFCFKKTVKNYKMPYVVKESISSGGDGVYFIQSQRELNQFIKSEFNEEQEYIIEDFIQGEEYSVEILGMDGNFQICPPLYKGNSAIGEHALDKTRICPVKENKICNQIKKLSTEIAKSIDLNGVMEVELIWDKNKLAVIEINPRFSGTTDLTQGFTRSSAIVKCLDIMEGKFTIDKFNKSKHMSIQLLLDNGVKEEVIEKANELGTFYKIKISKRRKDSLGTVILAGQIEAVIADIKKFEMYLKECSRNIIYDIEKVVLDKVKLEEVKSRFI